LLELSRSPSQKNNDKYKPLIKRNPTLGRWGQVLLNQALFCYC
jgi:hypothetical protein